MFFLIAGFSGNASPVVISHSGDGRMDIGRHVEVFEDKKGTMSLEDVMTHGVFHPVNQQVLNLGLSDAAFWVRFTVSNQGNRQLLLELGQATIDYAGLYILSPGQEPVLVEEGEFRAFGERKYKHQHYIFDLAVPPQEERTYLLKIRSNEQITVPLSIGIRQHIFESLMTKDLVLGLFFGVMVVMILYNLFIYFTVRDNTYIFYVAYILLFALSQASLHGYSFRFLWPQSTWMAQHSTFIFPSLASIAGILFAKIFLHTNKYVPRLDRVLYVLIGIFSLSVLLAFFGRYQLSFAIMQNNTLLTSLYLIILAILVFRKGYRSAQYFLVAWSALLLGATILVLRDYGVFPSNNFTSNALVFGSAIEVVLLSFALSDKINTLRREKEDAQGQMLLAYAENERMIKEQNLILETKVRERTLELQASNEGLNNALTELKDTQTQLVESEKMASLGQLTAGIAHEINNPINFVTSNIMPLQRDIGLLGEAFEKIEELAVSGLSTEDKQQQIAAIKDDIEYDYLKTEIEYLLKGISEGSTRTAEIVKGLRVFSRLDEDDLKQANIHDGLDSTLVIINSLLNTHISVTREYSPDLTLIECYPGKLNQVFLNILTNAIHAVNKRWEEKEGGNIRIQTLLEQDEAIILLGDNGTGMDQETANHIFEPFFTTKDVGEGTGLGLSIVYNIIRKHNGSITVQSIPGEGTTFTIRIPVRQQTI